MTDAEILLAARANPGARPDDLPAPPRDMEAAYAIQRAVQAALGAIGGWKVGAPPSGGFTCAPLPAAFVKPGPLTVPQAECPDRGVEAEIAVMLGRDLPPREVPYSREEVIAAIQSAHPAIELLQSRFRDVDKAAPMSAMADALSHYGLVYGPAIADWESINLARETVRVIVNGAEVKVATGNPAGEMIRLVEWLANEGSRWAGGLKQGQVVTTGSWTGKDTVPAGGTVEMRFERCGAVSATYA